MDSATAHARRVVDSPGHWIIAALSLTLSCRAAPTPRPDATPLPREGVVTTDDGLRLAYRTAGQGPSIVIVPGDLFLYRDFLYAAVAGTDFTLVFYDMRNRGRSDVVGDSAQITIDHDVRDLEAVRRHVHAEQFIPVGWSYLGRMVMLYAAVHPDRVKRIVQIAPLGRRMGATYPIQMTANDPGPVPDSASLRGLAQERAAGLAERDPETYCVHEWSVMRSRLVGEASHASQVPNLCGFRNEWPTHLEPHFRHLFTSMYRTPAPTWEEFSAIRVPVLTIHGTRDRNVPYGAGREWASQLPNARLVTVPGAGHMVWLDQPELVFRAIETFLRGGWPAVAVVVPVAADSSAGQVSHPAHY